MTNYNRNSGNTSQEALLEVMLLKSLEQADQIREHVELLRDKMTEIRMALNNVQSQGKEIPEAIQKIRSLETKTLIMEKDLLNIDTNIRSLQEAISNAKKSAEADLVETNKKTKDSITLLEGRIDDLDKKVDDLRSQQAKWVGALGVLGVIFTLVISMLKDYIKLGH